jgi:hypothetical protein
LARACSSSHDWSSVCVICLETALSIMSMSTSCTCSAIRHHVRVCWPVT